MLVGLGKKLYILQALRIKEDSKEDECILGSSHVTPMIDGGNAKLCDV